MNTFTRRLLSGFIGAGGCVAFTAAASAQSSLPGGNIGAATGPVVGTAAPKPPKAPEPPALPGTHSERNEAAPAGKSVADMAPTEALFDAINRGDTASARDAVNRGADLGARNILGMTPTELSVDLARNDITFLLLSMRGTDGSSSEPTRGRAPGPSTVEAKPGRAPRVAATAVVPRAPRNAAAGAADPARQFANGPVSSGTPVPQAGFLGFGVTR